LTIKQTILVKVFVTKLPSWKMSSVIQDKIVKIKISHPWYSSSKKIHFSTKNREKESTESRQA
jgi:hypothetical protein